MTRTIGRSVKPPIWCILPTYNPGNQVLRRPRSRSRCRYQYWAEAATVVSLRKRRANLESRSVLVYWQVTPSGVLGGIRGQRVCSMMVRRNYYAVVVSREMGSDAVAYLASTVSDQCDYPIPDSSRCETLTTRLCRGVNSQILRVTPEPTSPTSVSPIGRLGTL